MKPILTSKFRSPLRYPGGKQKAISQIAEIFPNGAKEYREPMVGGGSVFMHARNINFAEQYWINDRFEELVAFWQTCQNKTECSRLMSELTELRNSFSNVDDIKRYFLSAREEHFESHYRQAFLFFFFNRVTFSGTTRAGGFSKAAAQNRFTASSIERLSNLPDALREVRISSLSFKEIIEAPGSDVFIFLDPPYYTAKRLYGKDGSLHAFDHEGLADCLKKSEHKFLITYDDCEEIRELYSGSGIKIEPWQLQYGMNNCNLENKSKIGSEIFIYNYAGAE